VQDLTTATVVITNAAGTGKMQLTITADPNGLFSTDYSQMTTNPFLASQYEDDNRTAWDVIQKLVAIGDINDNRYTFGIYNGLRAIYAAMPTTATYQHRIAGREVEVETYGTESTIKPWDVLPARWSFLVDFSVGRTQPADQRLDPRFLFIESVRYTAPEGLQISGNKVSKIPQILAKKGMW